MADQSDAALGAGRRLVIANIKEISASSTGAVEDVVVGSAIGQAVY